jgi:ketosteroid isomerase-like protein
MDRQTCEAAPASAAANRELVRSICAHWQRGDFSCLEWADPKIEYVIADGPSPGAWTGLDGMADAFREVLSAYAAYQVQAEELWELDQDRVLVLHGYSGRGRTSGLELGDIPAKGADVFHIADGRVTRLVLYWKGDHALSELGLVPA